MEKEFRTGIEKIVLEAQVRANKAKFKYDTFKGTVAYDSEQLKIYEEVFNQLQDLFVYIASVYDKLTENDTSN